MSARSRPSRASSSGCGDSEGTSELLWEIDLSHRHRPNGNDILTGSSLEGSTLYETDTETTTSSDFLSVSTEVAEDINRPNDVGELRDFLDAESEKRNVFQSHFTLSNNDQAPTRTILQSLESYWSLLSTIETLPLPPLPSRNNRSSAMIDNGGGTQAASLRNWEVPMLEALEEICGENFESEGLKEALRLIITAGLHRRSTGATRRARGPNHIIWRDVATALSELSKRNKQHGGLSHDDESDSSGADNLGGKRKLDAFKDKDLSPLPPKRRLARKGANSTDNNTSFKSKYQGNGRENQSSRSSSQRTLRNPPHHASNPFQSGLQGQNISISSQPPSSTPYDSRSNHSLGRRPVTRSSSGSSVHLEDDFGSFNHYRQRSSSPSSGRPASYSPTPSSASASARNKASRRRPSFGSRAFRATSKVYPLYPWMSANRTPTNQSEKDDDSGYEDVFDNFDDMDLSDGHGQSSHESQSAFEFTNSSTPNLSLQHSLPSVNHSMPDKETMRSGIAVQDAQGQLLTPQKTPASNRFLPSPSLPMIQQLRDFGHRFLFNSGIATFQASSPIQGSNTEIATPQKEPLRETETTVFAKRPVRGRPRAFSDVKRVRLRNGERLIIVSEDDA